MAFVFKVMTLAIRTASKPLANRFQNYVLTHPTLRPAVLKFAQGLHAVEFAMNRLSEGKPIGVGKKFVARLDDERAMDLAGKFVSEGFVLAVAVGVLAWDYQRGAAKDEVKKAKELEYRAGVDEHFSEIKDRLDRQSQQAEEIFSALRTRQDLLDRQMQELQQDRENSGWWPWKAKEKAD